MRDPPSPPNRANDVVSRAAMWRRVAPLLRPGRAISSRSPASSSSSAAKAKVQTVSVAVDSMLLCSLKEHYLEVSKMTPPPGFLVEGALDNDGPVLKRTFNNEEISILVTRLVNIIPSNVGENESEDDINQLFLHVCVSKPEQEEGLHFLCGLYLDALGIHSVSMRPELESSGYAVVPSKYNDPLFENLDEKVRDAFHAFELTLTRFRVNGKRRQSRILSIIHDNNCYYIALSTLWSFLQTGQVGFNLSQGSTHWVWKKCPQLGKSLTKSLSL